MSIRRLAPKDMVAFLTVRSEGLRFAPESFRITESDDRSAGREYWAKRLDEDVVVAFECDEVIVGVGGLQRIRGDKLSHKALIWGMYVQPAARGSGAASAIVDALIDSAPTGVRQIQLTVMADNERARRLYERHGFRVYAIEPASVRIGQEFKDEALMWRLL